MALPGEYFLREDVPISHTPPTATTEIACKVTYRSRRDALPIQTTNYTAGCYKTQAEAVQACQKEKVLTPLTPPRK